MVVCPDVEGMLISWFACVDLTILPQDYPRPIRPTVLHVDKTDTAEMLPLPLNIGDTSQTAVLKEKLLTDFADVFDTSGPLKTMVGPPTMIEPHPVCFAQRSLDTI